MKPKTVLITGAAGYLGSALCERFLQAEFKVKALDVRADAEEILVSILGHSNFEFMKGDVRDGNALSVLLNGADVIIPAAAIVGAPKCDKDPKSARQINFESIQLLDSLRSPEQVVLFPMTNNGYQSGEYVTEESLWNSKGSLYTQSKYEAEQLLLESGSAVSFRLASLFGVSLAMRWDLLIHFLVRSAFVERKIDLFDAQYKRSFLHLKDAADCFVFAASNVSRIKSEIYNLGLASANMSKQDLVNQIAEFIPDLSIRQNVVETDPDSRDFFISTEKLKRAGFEASRSTQSGIEEILNFLKTHDLTLRGVA